MTGRRDAAEAVIVRITGIDPDGEAIGRPVEWPDGAQAPVVFMRPERRDQPALVPGDRVLAQLKPIGRGKCEGRTLRRLDDAPARLVGVFEARNGGRIVPTDRRVKAEWRVPPGETGGAEAGEIVLATPLPHGGSGLKPARVTERLGRMGEAGSVSLLAIHLNQIPWDFPADALAEAEAGPAGLEGREDLRALPLVTIDGEDARDFDDAVWAEADGAGFRLVVAIADVAHYVRPGGALDREARLRGNSVYFPDRVVPMLPEALSNGWCSLRPGEDRPCLFAEITIDATGRKTGHRFGRGIMRSAARLTYQAAQDARDQGETLPTLFAAFRALLGARQARGALDLDLAERQVILRDGVVEAVRPRLRLDSHRLVEEFMILANVAAAETLEERRLACIYRVHAPPSDDKIEALRVVLHGLGIGLPAGNQLHPRDLERALRLAAGTPDATLVSEIVLRSQSQAEYAADNIGHFGLALTRYAHFTSPIRRYADLLVHRALVGEATAGLAEIARHVTMTERRAAQAERDALERYLATLLAAQVGATFAARVTGVQRFGIFVTLAANGAAGLVPVSGFPTDIWHYDAASQTFSGRRTGMTFRLAQDIDIRLTEANMLTGGVTFDIPSMTFGRP